MIDSCSKCKFCDPIPGTRPEVGLCRKHPPEIYTGPGGPVSGQPQVSLINGWCGEGEAGLSKLAQEIFLAKKKESEKK